VPPTAGKNLANFAEVSGLPRKVEFPGTSQRGGPSEVAGASVNCFLERL
jgi:hypothetical protein